MTDINRAAEVMQAGDIICDCMEDMDDPYDIAQALADAGMLAGGWRDISDAPKDGTKFLALNHDREVWACKIDEYGRFLFRQNGRREPKKFEVVTVDGEKLLREDEAFAAANEKWESAWAIWSRLFEFKPTHFMPLPLPPAEG